MSLRLACVLFACGVFALTGCGDDAKPGCVARMIAPLADSPATRLPNAKLERIGDGFGLIARDGDALHWTRLTEQGALADSTPAVTSMSIPARTVGPWYALGSKTRPGDQLVVVIGVQKSGATGPLEVQAIVQDLGAAAPAAPRKLFEVPAGVNLSLFRADMRSSRSGRHAGFVWGFEGQVLPELWSLGADGEPVGPGVRVKDAPAKWDCLSIIPAHSDYGISTIGRPENPSDNASWAISDYTEDGNLSSAWQLPLSTREAQCPVIAPASRPEDASIPRAYGISYQNSDGTFFAELDFTTATADPVLVVGSVRFGGASKQPPLGGMASVGKDYSVLLERSKGPEIWRVNVFGRRSGSALHLTSSGTVGPVSTWSAGDAMFVTYLDRGAGAPPLKLDGGSSALPLPSDAGVADAAAPADAGGQTSGGGTRYLVRVECPTDL